MNIVLGAAAGYFVLLFAVRLIGRRTVSMMAPFDLVLLLLFGGITIGVVVGEDHSMVGAVSTVFTLGLILFSEAEIPVGAAGRSVETSSTLHHQDRFA
jgi:uncharacterized membrane protein YcaP (DUF421 family)